MELLRNQFNQNPFLSTWAGEPLRSCCHHFAFISSPLNYSFDKCDALSKQFHMEHALYFVWKSDPVSVFMVHMIKTKLPKQSVVKETRAVSEPILIFIPCQQFPHGRDGGYGVFLCSRSSCHHMEGYSQKHANIHLTDAKTSTYNMGERFQTIPDPSQKQTSVSKYPNSK